METSKQIRLAVEPYDVVMTPNRYKLQSHYNFHFCPDQKLEPKQPTTLSVSRVSRPKREAHLRLHYRDRVQWQPHFPLYLYDRKQKKSEQRVWYIFARCLDSIRSIVRLSDLVTVRVDQLLNVTELEAAWVCESVSVWVIEKYVILGVMSIECAKYCESYVKWHHKVLCVCIRARSRALASARACVRLLFTVQII